MLTRVDRIERVEEFARIVGRGVARIGMFDRGHFDVGLDFVNRSEDRARANSVRECVGDRVRIFDGRDLLGSVRQSRRETCIEEVDGVMVAERAEFLDRHRVRRQRTRAQRACIDERAIGVRGTADAIAQSDARKDGHHRQNDGESARIEALREVVE